MIPQDGAFTLRYPSIPQDKRVKIPQDRGGERKGRARERFSVHSEVSNHERLPMETIHATFKVGGWKSMHEMSIAQSLVEIIREEMARNNAHALRVVRLHVGEMSAIVPDSLSFCFEVITAGTDMEGARLNIEVIPVEGECRACGERFKIENYQFLCPKCGGTGIEMVAGQELSIVEIEVDE